MNLSDPLRPSPGIRILAILLFLLGINFNPLPLLSLAQSNTPLAGTGYASAVVRVGVGNLRAQPDLNALVIDKIKQGNRLQVIESRPPWYLVKLEDARRGWVHASLIDLKKGNTPTSAPQTPSKKPVPAPAGKALAYPVQTQYAVDVATGRVRKEPNLQADIVFRLRQGARVQVKGLQQDWFLIEDVNGRSGWAHQKLFVPAPASLPDPATSQILIKAVRHLSVSTQTEKVLFELSGFHPPQTFTINGDRPRLVCDFKKARLGPGVKPQVSVNGTLIKDIRIARHQGHPSKVRIVLDLVPDRAYEVEQIFYQQESQFILTLNSSKED